MAEPTSGKKPVMDVAKPGKTPADATARPIITGHAVMKDPMVNATDTKDTSSDPLAGQEPSQSEATAPSVTHKVIKPLESAETEEPTKDTPAPPKQEEPDTAITDGAVVDAVLDQVTDKKKEEAIDEEALKRQELVDKLTQDKKYFLPINQVNSRRNNRLVLLLLGALLPVIVGLGLAADAGAINLGFKVPFDFIKDKSGPVVTTAPITAKITPKATPSVIDTSASSKTKEYTDTAKLYSVTYPDNWIPKTIEPLNDKQVTPGVLSSGVTFAYPNSIGASGVVISAGNTNTFTKSILTFWDDSKYVVQTKMVNGYSTKYTRVEFKNDIESYTEENYLVSKGDYYALVTFREKYHRESPVEDWDASKAKPGFETILNSIKFLK